MKRTLICLLAAWASLAQAQAQPPPSLDKPISLSFRGMPLANVAKLILESQGFVATNPEALDGTPAINLQHHGVPARQLLTDVLRCGGFGFTQEGVGVTFVPLSGDSASECVGVSVSADPPAANAPGLLGSHTELALRFEAGSRDASSAAPEAAILAQISAHAGLALTTVNVECRTDVCRVQATGPKVGDTAGVLRQLTGFRRVVARNTVSAQGVPTLDVFLERETLR